MKWWLSAIVSGMTKFMTRTGPYLQHELSGTISRNLNDAVRKVANFIAERGNPYESKNKDKLHNFTSGQVVSRESSIRLLNYFKHGKER